MATQRKCEFETTNPRWQPHNYHAANLMEASETRRCGRNAVVKENGKYYCWNHASALDDADINAIDEMERREATEEAAAMARVEFLRQDAERRRMESVERRRQYQANYRARMRESQGRNMARWMAELRDVDKPIKLQPKPPEPEPEPLINTMGARRLILDEEEK